MQRITIQTKLSRNIVTLQRSQAIHERRQYHVPFRSLYEPGVTLARLAELTWAGRVSAVGCNCSKYTAASRISMVLSEGLICMLCGIKMLGCWIKT